MKTIAPAGAASTTWLLVGLFVLFLPQGVLAADPAWRPTYDLALRWLNFFLLVAVIVKYAREPIKDFLQLRKRDVASEIESLEKEKSRIVGEIEATRQKSSDNQLRLQELKARLVSQGEARKREIVQQAQQQSTIMLEEAQRKLQHQIVVAKANLKKELLDMAMDQAVHQLPALMTDEDNQRMINQYMAGIQPQ